MSWLPEKELLLPINTLVKGPRSMGGGTAWPEKGRNQQIINGLYIAIKKLDNLTLNLYTGPYAGLGMC